MVTNFVQQAILSCVEKDKVALPSYVIPDTRTDGRNFKNPIFKLSGLSACGISISNTGRTNSFSELSTDRNPANNTASLQSILNEISQGGRLLSNIGVSVAVNVKIAGQSYALMVYRARDDRHMLLSGYVDANLPEGQKTTSRGLMARHALEQVGEEFIPAYIDGVIGTGIAQGDLIRDVLNELVIGQGEDLTCLDGTMIKVGGTYKALSYDSQEDRRWKLQSTFLPTYLYNLFPTREITFDGVALQATGIQYAKQWNAAQLFFSFDLNLAQDCNSLFLFHAEDGPVSGGEKWELETKLNTNGLVLVELDQAGHLTDRTFFMREGVLVPRNDFNHENIKLSEAFSGSINSDKKYRGMIDTSDIMFRDYRKIIEDL